MSLFDIDWNNDGKIDFKDTLYDMALVDEDERNTSRSDYSDDDIYDTDDLEILLSDNINISSSNTLVNNSGWLDNVPYELLSCWYLFHYDNEVYFNDYIKTLKSLHKCSYGVSVGVNVRIYTDNLDGDYKEAYIPFLNNLISNEIKKENEKAEKKRKQRIIQSLKRLTKASLRLKRLRKRLMFSIKRLRKMQMNLT